MATLDAMIDRIEALGELAKEAAPDAAHAVDRALRKQIAEAEDPEGKAWELREDGQKPLATAGKSLAVVARGTTVFCRLRGHVARHNNGTATGGKVRRILPKAGVPKALAVAIRQAVDQKFREIAK